MLVLPELLYSETHEWVKKLPNGNVWVGVTDHAQEALSDVVFVSLASVGDKLSAGDPLGDIESIKAVSQAISPVSGTVAAVNAAVTDDPSLVNREPYKSWLVEMTDAEIPDSLMDAAAYEAFAAEGN